MMIHLRSIAVRDPKSGEFPFNIPVIRSLSKLELTTEVTFLVGENGSGKSTLLEAIACAARLNTIGSMSTETDHTLAEIRLLSRNLKLAWSKKTHLGFFMRSEDFFGYVKKMNAVRQDLQRELKIVDEEYRDRSQAAQGYARMAYVRELHAVQQDYGEGLDASSHGESYFRLFKARFVPGGLYLLDEPEAPLSPMRQLGFLAMLKHMVDQNAQFIIATHSPIIMAFPGAMILSFADGVIQETQYEDLEHVIISRGFLNNPAQFLRHLLDQPEDDR
jgi:predicted ATPase